MKKTNLIVMMFIAASLTSARAQTWLLNGNSGTSDAVNFIGTTDNMGFKIRTDNSVRVNVTNNGNVAIGDFSPSFRLDVKNGSINTDSVYCIAGNTILAAKWNGNTAIGIGAGPLDQTGMLNTGNTSCGWHALFSSTNGIYNVAIGREALTSNISGHSNIGIGMQAAYSNTTGSSNTAVGSGALSSNVAGSRATAVGDDAMYFTNNTSSSYSNYNVAVGYQALRGSTVASANTGNSNTALGYQVLLSHTTGNGNTATGYLALNKNTTGGSNTGTGYQVLYNNIKGGNNTAAGVNSLYNNSTGNYNAAFGYSTGSTNDTNTRCTFIGYDADQTVTTNFNNSTAIGNTSRITASNQVRAGNASVTSIGGYTSWSNLSDGRYKKEIKEDVPGLDFILKLRPVTYHLDVNLLAEKLGEDLMDDENGNVTKQAPDAATQKSREEKSKIVQTGFIAQEVEAAAAESGYDFSGVDKPKDENDLYGLRYAEFVVPVVKSIQELNEKIQKSEVRNQELKEENEMIKSVLTEEQHQKLKSLRDGKSLSRESSGGLEQNVPNPFHEETQIKFHLPAKFNSARLVIVDESGKQIRTYHVQSSEIEVIKGGELSAGVYTYSLVIDGNTVDSKQMILTK